MNVPRGFRVAVALGAAAIAAGGPAARAQGLALEGDGALPGRRATALGVFTGVVSFSDQVEIGNSYYDDQVPGLGMSIGLRGAAELVRRGSSRLDVEAELRLAFARTGSGGPREAGAATLVGWRAHALVELFTDRAVRPFLLAGAGAESLIGGTEFMSVPDTDLVLYGGAGAELPVGRRSALRADLRLLGMAARDSGAAAAFEAAVGWTLRFGGRGPRVGRIQIAARPAAPPAEFVPVDPPAPAPADPPSPPPPVAAADPAVARDGGSDPVPAELAARIGELAGVRFARGSVRLDRRSRPILDELSAVLLRYPDVRVEIGAHTQASGKPERDLELSQRQAAYIKWYLVDKGIDEGRIQAVGHGAAAAGGGRIAVELVKPD